MSEKLGNDALFKGDGVTSFKIDRKGTDGYDADDDEFLDDLAQEILQTEELVTEEPGVETRIKTDNPYRHDGFSYAQLHRAITENLPLLSSPQYELPLTAIQKALWASVRFLEWQKNSNQEWFIQIGDVQIVVSSEGTVTAHSGLNSFRIFGGIDTGKFKNMLDNAQHALSTIHVDSNGERWYEDEGREMSVWFRGQMAIALMGYTSPTIETLQDLTDAIESLMNGQLPFIHPMGALTTTSNDALEIEMPEYESTSSDLKYTDLISPILDVLAASVALPEWKYIPNDDGLGMYFLWTVNDTWCLKISSRNVTFFSKTNTEFDTVTITSNTNALMLFNLFEKREHFAADYFNIDSIESYFTPESLVECKPCHEDAGSETCIRPSHQLSKESEIELNAKIADVHAALASIEQEIMNEDVNLKATKNIGGTVPLILNTQETDSVEKIAQVQTTIAPPPMFNDYKLQALKSVEGRILTIMEAAFSDKAQRDAIKTLIKKEFRREMSKGNRNNTE